jgi:hypothetical protein
VLLSLAIACWQPPAATTPPHSVSRALLFYHLLRRSILSTSALGGSDLRAMLAQEALIRLSRLPFSSLTRN